MIDPISMQIAVVSHKFSSGIVKYVKIFHLKPLKINLNIVLEMVIFGVWDCILIEPVYCIFIKDIMVSYLNVYTIAKRIFRSALGLYESSLKTLKTPAIESNY